MTVSNLCFAHRDLLGSLAPDLAVLDAVLRKGVKINDEALAQVKKIVEETKILSALQKAKEKESQEQSLPRSTSRAKDTAPASSVYDFDGSGDSPMPSPNPSVARRMAGSSGSKADRSDSVPPKMDRSTPTAKAGSVEPQGPAASVARSKVTFAKGDEVAFKPKPQSNEQTDWILGIVEDVRGEGKSRRYKVLDADVDDAGEKKVFRTSASSMIAIPKDGTLLPPLENGKTVLALYPNTTTFYKAEVMSMDSEGKVNLKFEGEESSNTMQAVGRRHVVEYRA
jgi:SAGA-associated factor 29